MGQTKTKVLKTETMETKRVDLFTLVKHNGKVRICLGNTCVHHEEFKSFNDAEKAIQNRDWELLINSCAYTIQQHFNLKNN